MAFVSMIIALIFLIHRILLQLPVKSIRQKIINNCKSISALVKEEDFRDGLFGYEMYKVVLKQAWNEVFKELTAHQSLPDDLILVSAPPHSEGAYCNALNGDSSEGPIKINLKELCKPGVPLVINFGNCS